MFYYFSALWVILIPVTVLEISMIVLGTVYKENCPYERMIPVYLIVKGSLVVANIFFHFLYQFVINEPENSLTRTRRGMTFLVNCFLAVWTTVGNAWVLRFQRPVLDDVTNPLYCHVNLYRFAFVVTVIEDVVILLGILGLVASLMYSFMKVSRTTPVLPLCEKYRQKKAKVKQIPTQVTEIDLE